MALLYAIDPVEPGKHVEDSAERDGPSLEVWRPGLREENVAELVRWVQEQDEGVSKRVLSQPYTPPAEPNIGELMALIKAKSKYEELCLKRGRKKDR